MKTLFEDSVNKIVESKGKWYAVLKSDNANVITEVDMYHNAKGKAIHKDLYTIIYYTKSAYGLPIPVKVYRGDRPKATKEWKDLQIKFNDGEVFSIGVQKTWDAETVNRNKVILQLKVFIE